MRTEAEIREELARWRGRSEILDRPRPKEQVTETEEHKRDVIEASVKIETLKWVLGRA